MRDRELYTWGVELRLPPCVSMIPAGEALAAIHTPFCFHTCWLTCSANFENYLGPLSGVCQGSAGISIKQFLASEGKIAVALSEGNN